MQVPPPIFGVVVTRAGGPVVGADVMLTRAPDMASVSTVSDSAGAFRFLRPGGTGEYLLSVSAKGYRNRRQRVVSSASIDTIRVALEPDSASQVLSPVVVLTKRTTPEQTTGFEVGTGSSATVVDGVGAALPPASDRIADAAGLALGSTSRGGVSVLGLAPSESQVQLGGLLFRGDALPRNAPRVVRTTISSYDVANGGFSGALVSVDVSAASEFDDRRGDLGFVGTAFGTNPQSQGGGYAAASQLLADIGGSTRFNGDRSGLTGGARLAVSRMPLVSIETASSDVLHSFGVAQSGALAASDVAARRLALPIARPGPDAAEVRFTSLFRFDPRLSRDAVDAFVFGGSGSSRDGTASQAAFSTTRDAEESSGDVFIQWQHRHYTVTNALWDVRAGLSASAATTRPSSTAATILVDTRQTTGQPDSLAGTVVLGGNAGAALRTNRQVAELVAQREQFAGDHGRHKLKLYASGRVDLLQLVRAPSVDLVGFSSLDDFTNSQAAWVSSSQVAPSLSGQATRLSIGVGDEWRLRDRLRLQFGARLDAQQLLGASGSRVDVPPSLGPSWDLPLELDLSPRIGLTWAFAAPTSSTGYSSSPLFQRHLIPSGIMRLGLGIFQRDWEPDAALQPGGSWSQHSDVWCSGGTVSPVDWAGVRVRSDSLSRLCTAPTGDPFARRRTAVALLGQGVRAPSSLRANASVLTAIRSVDVLIEGVWNDGQNQLGHDDWNVARTPFAALSGEGGRSLFVSPAAINAASGIARPDANRLSDSVSTAFVYASNRRSTTTQLLLQLSPHWYDDIAVLRLGYLWSHVRSLEGGWDRDAFGDPRALEWADAANDSRHQVQLEVGYAWGALSATLWLRAASGVPYTPLVDGDVNGDGNSGNDRAFVFAPPSLADTALANGLATLLQNGTGGARDCLQSQVGRPAARASCRGPWTVTSNLTLRIEGKSVGLGSRVAVNLTIENVAGVVDRMLHGSHDLGWGGTAPPDPYLFRVRGFDSTTHTFKYDVNQNFGRPLSGSGLLSTPLRVTIGASIDLAPPVERQQLDRWLRNGGVTERRTRPAANELAARFARNVPDLYATVLEARDELYLTEGQMNWIGRARARFDQAFEREWGSLGRDLVSLPDSFDSEFALERIQRATDAAWEISRLEAHRLREILTPIQESLLPWPASALIKAEQPVKFRVYYR